MAPDDHYPVKATKTSFELLEVLTVDGPLGVTALASKTDVSKGTVYNHLSTLRMLGYVKKPATRTMLHFGRLRWVSACERGQRYTRLPDPISITSQRQLENTPDFTLKRKVVGSVSPTLLSPITGRRRWLMESELNYTLLLLERLSSL
ncbi:helix-turn-helix domain-containing protein [Halocatena marina]|uniref:helix-turn-helix domain-containing protein n=1 Tax=Halocatena marina TaxID=2934937 RepID=UPI003622CF89